MATGDETQAGPRPELPPRRPAAPRPEPTITGRPQILAPQANEWASSGQEVELVKRRGPGPMLLFLLAGLVVAVGALGLAAWSVFRGGDDTTTVADPTTETPVEPTDTVDTGLVDPTEPTTAAPAPIDPTALQVELTEEPFICDGGTREFGVISGAEPEEEISFVSPQADALRSGTADAAGNLPIRWQCTPDQAGTTWELTATGAVSGKTVTFIFAGAALPVGQTPTGLQVNVIEDPFRCDGASRIFGGLSGADAGEEIAFTSPQASGISNGTADANGELSIRWSCSPDQAGTTWELTATGVTSGRSVTFTFTGS